MPRESKSQKKTVGRVMHEFKHGELQSGSGKKVKSARQAIAIGLSEAGASRKKSPAQNKRSQARTERRERTGRTGKARSGGSRGSSATARSSKAGASRSRSQTKTARRTARSSRTRKR